MKKSLLLLVALCCVAMTGVFTSCQKEKEVVQDIVEIVEVVEPTVLPAQIYEMTYGKTRSEATLALLDAGYTIEIAGMGAAMPALRMPMRVKSYGFSKTLSNGDLEYVELYPDEADKITSCAAGFSYKYLPDQREYNARALAWCEFAKKQIANPAYIQLAMLRDDKEYYYQDAQFIEQSLQQLNSDYAAGNISATEYKAQLEILEAILPNEQFFVDMLTDVREHRMLVCGYAGADKLGYFIQGNYDIYETKNPAVIVCQMGVIN